VLSEETGVQAGLLPSKMFDQCRMAATGRQQLQAVSELSEPNEDLQQGRKNVDQMHEMQLLEFRVPGLGRGKISAD